MNAPQGNGCLDFWLSLTQIRRYYMFTFCYFEVFVNSILARIGSNFITKSIWIYRIKTLLPKLRSDAIMTRLDASVTPISVQYGVMKIFWPPSPPTSADVIYEWSLTITDKWRPKWQFVGYLTFNFLKPQNYRFTSRGRSQTTFTRGGGEVVKKIDFL